MNIVIKVKKTGENSTLSHRWQERYMAFRDAVLNSFKSMGKKLLSTFSFHPCHSPLNSKGFTLVEMAVVLVILGALFMSVLKVESMIKNAKIRQVINQYRELRTAILVYKDKYGYLPGDDPKASVHVGAGHNGNGDNKWLTGNEFNYVQEHLSKAGLISGKYDGNYALDGLFPNTPLIHVYGGRIYVMSFSAAAFKPGLGIRFDGLPYDVAGAIDTVLDDGKYNTGSIRANEDYTALATSSTRIIGLVTYTPGQVSQTGFSIE